MSNTIEKISGKRHGAVIRKNVYRYAVALSTILHLYIKIWGYDDDDTCMKLLVSVVINYKLFLPLFATVNMQILYALCINKNLHMLLHMFYRVGDLYKANVTPAHFA